MSTDGKKVRLCGAVMSSQFKFSGTEEKVRHWSEQACVNRLNSKCYGATDQYERTVLDSTRKTEHKIPLVGSSSILSPSRSRQKLIKASNAKADLCHPPNQPASILTTPPGAPKPLDLVQYLEHAIPSSTMDN